MRQSLTQYLETGVEPLLQGTYTSTKTHNELLSIASQLYYLCGFTGFDDELHGGALRYYRTSLRLAAEAHNAEVYAIALRAMSVQAHVLGHRNQAVRLAEIAAETLADKASPRQAFVLGRLAVARAAAGDRRAAVTDLRRAERHFERVADPQVIGTHHAASLAHQRAAVCIALRDRTGATEALMESIRHRQPPNCGRVRSPWRRWRNCSWAPASSTWPSTPGVVPRHLPADQLRARDEGRRHAVDVASTPPPPRRGKPACTLRRAP